MNLAQLVAAAKSQEAQITTGSQAKPRALSPVVTWMLKKGYCISYTEMGHLSLAAGGRKNYKTGCKILNEKLGITDMDVLVMNNGSVSFDSHKKRINHAGFDIDGHQNLTPSQFVEALMKAKKKAGKSKKKTKKVETPQISNKASKWLNG